LQPRAVIESVWVDHNVSENNQTGMRIHVKFTINNLKDSTGQVSAYFYMASGEKVQAKNGYYTTPDGQVAVGSNFVPSYDNALFNDFSFFLPYDALQFGSGSYDLKFHVSIYTPEYRLALSDYKTFTLTVR
ncbi:MAG TPA: hypothetical protein VF276_02550, partial [Chloroflexia bacterium]